MVARVCQKFFSTWDIDRVVKDIGSDILENIYIIMIQNFDCDRHSYISVYLGTATCFNTEAITESIGKPSNSDSGLRTGLDVRSESSRQSLKTVLWLNLGDRQSGSAG